MMPQINVLKHHKLNVYHAVLLTSEGTGEILLISDQSIVLFLLINLRRAFLSSVMYV